MDTQKDQIVSWLKDANNVLVTVSANPSVDQLAAAIGLTLLLNKLGKHATAVYSGETPSTIEFLQPEKTLEKNTDSLRDFIIALDKSKADKLRYKVEDQMVKIFITPYRTSLSDKDLEFSQGDFNVDVVVALGVKQQADLDKAITSHGRILHDAKVVGVSTNPDQHLGNTNLIDTKASSLCEIVVSLGTALKPDVLDAQIATAFLTGIVAETDRFSNQKTTPSSMQMSSQLMNAGANQQLVSKELKNDGKQDLPQGDAKKIAKDGGKNPDDQGSLQIAHHEPPAPEPEAELPELQPEPEIDQISIDEDGQIKSPKNQSGLSENTRFVLQPPTLGGKLTANSEPEALDPSTDPLGSRPKEGPILEHGAKKQFTDQKPDQKPLEPPKPPEPEPPTQTASETPKLDVKPPEPPEIPSPSPFSNLPQPATEPKQTLSDIEKSTNSPHMGQTVNDSDSSLDAARDAVNEAVSSSSNPLMEPIKALNAKPMLDLNTPQSPPEPPKATPEQPSPMRSENVQSDPGLPPGIIPDSQQAPSASTPPPVPPPLMPPSYSGGRLDDENEPTEPLAPL